MGIQLLYLRHQQAECLNVCVSIAHHGSDEVSSCLLKWLQLRQDEGNDFTTLRVFCDNCAGQNKNLYVILMALQQIHLRKLFRIEFVFLKPGHPYMPCDHAFGNIEKKNQKTNFVTCPKDYMEIMRSTVTRKFTVMSMVREDFYDFKKLASLVTNCHTPGFSRAFQLVVDTGYPKGSYIKANYDYQDTAHNKTEARLMKGHASYTRAKFDLSTVALTHQYTHDRLITVDKCNDLRTMLPLLGSAAKD